MKIALEPFASMAKDLGDMPEAHSREINGKRGYPPVCLDHELYQLLEDAGKLQVVTVRTEELIGYHVSLILKHAQHDMLYGMDDFFYLRPEHRKGLLGLKVLRFARDELLKRGAQRIFFSDTTALPLGPLYKRLNFKPAYTKYEYING